MKRATGLVSGAAMVSLAVLVCYSVLAGRDTGPVTEEMAARRAYAIQTQGTIDFMRVAIRGLRERSSSVLPAQRAVWEDEIHAMEVLLQETQRQLLLFGAEDAATRSLIERSFPLPTNQEMKLWKEKSG